MATTRAASRYFAISAGDIVNDSPELSKPDWFAGSTGNSRVGTKIHSREIADRVVVFGVAQPPGKHTTRIAGVLRGFVLLDIVDPVDDSLRLDSDGCFATLGGIAFAVSFSTTCVQ